MENTIKILLLILVLASCNSTNRIADKVKENPPTTNNSQYDVIPISEMKEIFKMAIDLPVLQQYFHIGQYPERAPLKVLELGEINSNTLRGIRKFGQPIAVFTKEELAKNQMEDYVGIGDWSPANGKLRLQMYYPIEGITINYMFEKAKSKWEITDALILEE